MNKTIFSEKFLAKYLYDFNLRSIPNIRGIQEVVLSLIDEFKSGKFSILKEEQIKSRFVTSFFGDVLHFNYGNGNAWMLGEEKKSVTDGTKPDAVLGYFYVDKIRDDVRVVVEVKDARTDLDEKQKREKSISAVEQGFNYAHKTGGNCSWVIVTNIREIRFYRSSDSSRYQRYFLEDLKDEEKLKELLFLFHKDRFMKHDLEDRSNTEKLLERAKEYKEIENERLHIIDRIYYSLKRFEEFGFVSPEYLASIRPFNILDEYVWHFSAEKLFTLNSEIYGLLTQITIKDKHIEFSEDLKQEIGSADFMQAIERLEWSFRFLNRCLIMEIHAVANVELEVQRHKVSKTRIFKTAEDNIVKLDINLQQEGAECDCLICNYRNLDFSRMIGKLKNAEGKPEQHSLEYAFGNFLVSSNDYMTSYLSLCELRNKVKRQPEKGVTYFFAALNSTYLYHLIQISAMESVDQARSDIRAIDLDKVLYNELEFYVEKEVLEYLKKVKNDELMQKVQDKVDELLEDISALKKLIDEGGSQTGPNYAYNLLISHQDCFLHLYHNAIFYFNFTSFKKINERILKALVISYNTPEHGLIFFNDFILTESILNVRPVKLQETLQGQKSIEVDEKTRKKILSKLFNFLKSYLKKDPFNGYVENDLLSVQLKNFGFLLHYRAIFSNIFTFLSRININKQDFEYIIKPLIAFLSIEDSLAHYNLREFENFIRQRGFLFSEKDLESILDIAIHRDEKFSIKYEGLLMTLPEALSKYYPAYRYGNKNQVKRLLLNCAGEGCAYFDYRKAVYMASVCDEICKKLLIDEFTACLSEKFNDDFYELLLLNGVISYTDGNYFDSYILTVNSDKSRGAYEFGELKLTNLIYLGFIIVVSQLKIDVSSRYFANLRDLNNFEQWLLDPVNFDYGLFEAVWLTQIAEFPSILKRLADIPQFPAIIDDSLYVDYNPSLAKIRYTYFKQSAGDLGVD